MTPLLIAGILSACAMFQPPARDPAPLQLPESYGFDAAGEPGPDQWWKSFDSLELNDLVAAALEHNFDMRAAWARLQQARAQLRIAGADLYPNLDAEAGASERRSRVENDNGSARSRVESYNLSLAAGYELDLWGRLRAVQQAQSLQLLATRGDLESAAVTISAAVVDTWAALIGVRQQIAILTDQIEINQNLVELQRFRFQNGLATALEVSQQMENLAAARAEMPPLKGSAQTLRNALALLTGRAGSAQINVAREQLPELIPLPATGIPSDLLSRRPDVRAAALRLQSSDWRVAAARADRLPSLNFTAGGGYASEDFSLLFSNWLTTLSASLTAPLFDAGRRVAEVERTRAVAEERLADYGRTVAEAFQEVADGLALEVTQREFIERLQEQLAAARMARQEARIRYLNGESDYLNFLIEIQNVQSLERRIVVQKTELIRLRVGLYRALGGDWTRNFGPVSEISTSLQSARYEAGDSHGHTESIK